MAHHNLKTHPAMFAAAVSGYKRFEFRKHDRPFKVGDGLTLDEFDPCAGGFTNRFAHFEITFILKSGEYGVPEGYCVLSIQPL